MRSSCGIAATSLVQTVIDKGHCCGTMCTLSCGPIILRDLRQNSAEIVITAKELRSKVHDTLYRHDLPTPVSSGVGIQTEGGAAPSSRTPPWSILTLRFRLPPLAEFTAIASIGDPRCTKCTPNALHPSKRHVGGGGRNSRDVRRRPGNPSRGPRRQCPRYAGNPPGQYLQDNSRGWGVCRN